MKVVKVVVKVVKVEFTNFIWLDAGRFFTPLRPKGQGLAGHYRQIAHRLYPHLSVCSMASWQDVETVMWAWLRDANEPAWLDLEAYRGTMDYLIEPVPHRCLVDIARGLGIETRQPFVRRATVA